MGKLLGVTDKYVGMIERGQAPVDEEGTLARLLAFYEKQAAQQGSRLAEEASEYQMSSPLETMKQARLRKGLAFPQLAKLTRYGADALERVETGQMRASEEMIKRIAQALELPTDALMAGADANVSRDGMQGSFGATPNLTAGPGVGRPKFVPFISMAQAGTMSGNVFTDGGYSYEGTIAFDPEDRRAFGVKIVGDSMAPNYTEGDVALVYPNAKPRNDDLVVARLTEEAGGGVFFKIYGTREGGNIVVLSSYNPAYDRKEIPRDHFAWIYPVEAVTKRLRRATR